jgi:hypothetical protein
MMFDGREPIEEFFAEALKNPRMVDRLAAIAIRFEEFARTGTLVVPDQLNDLGFGIWEVKAETLRAAFYYKEDHPSIRAVRLTNGFVKRQQRTPQKEIRFARKVREEDVQRG